MNVKELKQWLETIENDNLPVFILPNYQIDETFGIRIAFAVEQSIATRIDKAEVEGVYLVEDCGT